VHARWSGGAEHEWLWSALGSAAGESRVILVRAPLRFGVILYLFVASHVSEMAGMKWAEEDAPRTRGGTVPGTVLGAACSAGLDVTWDANPTPKSTTSWFLTAVPNTTAIRPVTWRLKRRSYGGLIESVPCGLFSGSACGSVSAVIHAASLAVSAVAPGGHAVVPATAMKLEARGNRRREGSLPPAALFSGLPNRSLYNESPATNALTTRSYSP
jgi:hypothetical protein